MRWLRRHQNWWIALALLAANGMAWLGAAADVDLPAVKPRLHPEVVALREAILSGEASGEPFHLVIDEQMAAEGVAWFLNRHPRIPFSHPQVTFAPGEVKARGLVHMFGLRTLVHGRASITLEEGVPVVQIEELGVAGAAIPGFMREAIQAEVERQFDFEENPLPFLLTRLELREGVMEVEGVYR